VHRLLPCHPGPKPDELLTSWIARVSYANGMTPTLFIASISEASGWMTDYDCSPSQQLNAALSARTGVHREEIESLTLASYEGVLFESRAFLGTLPSYILPLRLFRKADGCRLQYCPECIVPEPFYRRSWRLALNVLCTKHKRYLVDECTGCGAPITYLRAGTSEVRVGSTLPLWCASCGCAYAAGSDHSSVDAPLAEAQMMVERALARGYADLGRCQVHSLLFFMGVRHLLRVLASGNHGASLREVIRNANGLPNDEMGWRVGERFEFLKNTHRAGLLRLLVPLLRDWPREFVRYCRAARMPAEGLLHRYLTLQDVPYWCAREFGIYSARPRYDPSVEEIKAMMRYVQSGKDSSAVQIVRRFLLRKRATAKYRDLRNLVMEKSSLVRLTQVLAHRWAALEASRAA